MRFPAKKFGPDNTPGNLTYKYTKLLIEKKFFYSKTHGGRNWQYTGLVSTKKQKFLGKIFLNQKSRTDNISPCMPYCGKLSLALIKSSQKLFVYFFIRKKLFFFEKTSYFLLCGLLGIRSMHNICLSTQR